MQSERIRNIVLKRFVVFFSLSILALNAANMVMDNFQKHYSANGRVEISSMIARDEAGSLGGGIYLKDVARLREELQDCDIAYTAETGCILGNGSKIGKANLVMTDDLYAEFSGLEIVRGAFFSFDACEGGRNLAVISETTAKELYSSYNIIGSDIVISGIKYRIAGIYHSRHTLLSFLGDDGIERVYVPLESMDGYSRQRLGTIYVAGGSLAEDELRIYTVDDILSQKLFLDLNNLKISDYYGVPLAMSSVQAFCVFCAGAYIIWLIIRDIFKLVKAVLDRVKKSCTDYYFLEAVWFCRPDILKAGAVVVIELGFAFAVFLAVKFIPYLPSQVIPQENIFDFGFYAGKIKEAVEASNTSSFYFPSRLAEAGGNAFRLEILFLMVSITALVLCLSQLKLINAADCLYLDIINPLIISIALALLLTLVFSLATGFELAIAVKPLFVVIAAGVLYHSRKYEVSGVFLLQSM